MRCSVSPCAPRIFASFVAASRPKYERVTFGPPTTNSPIASPSTRSASLQSAMGSSLIVMISTRTPSTGRPTHTPAPAAVRAAVSRKISSCAMIATGSDSVAP